MGDRSSGGTDRRLVAGLRLAEMGDRGNSSRWPRGPVVRDGGSVRQCVGGAAMGVCEFLIVIVIATASPDFVRV